MAVIEAPGRRQAFERRLVGGEEHLRQHGRDDREVDGLLRDHVPGVDPADRDRVEDEAAGEKERRDAALVPRVIEPEALDCAQ